MKKLIKMYNEKYGDALGVIDDDFNKEQMYRIYYFIKNNCDDKDIQDRIKMINLDKPKTLEQQLTKLESENGNSNEMHNPYQNLKPFMTNGNFAYFDITNLKVGAYTPYQDIPQTAWVFQVTNKAGIKQTWFSSAKSRGCFIIVSSFNKTTGMVNVVYLIDTLVGMEYKQLIYDATNDTFTFNKERRTLLTNNTTEYNPTKKYHPTTKKYVDDKFICTDIIENVGTIPKEEMQKCNNGTSRYVSSINFKEFFADYKHYIYQGTYGDKNIRMIYDKEYNRILAYDLDSIDKYDMTLGFEFNNNYMYPFNGAASQVKSYQFTNDLVITKSPILNPSEIYSKGLKEYVGTKENPVVFTEIKNGWNIVKNYYKWYPEYENSIPCGTMLVHKHPIGKNFYITYMNGAELTRYTYNATTNVIKGYKHVLNSEVLNKYENNEYTPTENYHPATKKYVDDKVSSLPQFSFNENGELVVTINEVSKTFVPKSE